jgi:hypothetical protein
METAFASIIIFESSIWPVSLRLNIKSEFGWAAVKNDHQWLMVHIKYSVILTGLVRHVAASEKYLKL